MTVQAERTLQSEVMLRIQHAPVDAIVVPVPNGIWLPVHSESERTLVRRLIYRLKQDGMLVPGTADLLVLWASGAGAIELKRGASKTLLGPVAAGRQSDEQKAFEARCLAAGVPYTICTSWPEVRDTLISWRRLPENYRDPEARIGRAA